jgi:hypothetical protein
MRLLDCYTNVNWIVRVTKPYHFISYKNIQMELRKPWSWGTFSTIVRANYLIRTHTTQVFRALLQVAWGLTWQNMRVPCLAWRHPVFNNRQNKTLASTSIITIILDHITDHYRAKCDQDAWFDFWAHLPLPLAFRIRLLPIIERKIPRQVPPISFLPISTCNRTRDPADYLS